MLQFNIGVQGSADEVLPFMESITKAIQESSVKLRIPVLVNREAAAANFKPGDDGYYLQMVWSKITAKAKRALLYIANHDGCTKEEIVLGVKQLSDTRDLGGALSSVARRCKSLRFDLNVVYQKIDTPRGPRYIMADGAAEAVKKLGEHIDDNDPVDVVQGDADEE